ncbi:MAG: type I glyceraldehyde-3-phosphate dehydrogenase [Candidatus Pacebacteria bacterium]|nr:type I glyceraldehyde-3-phosphate dehydrogenase [Candidatus Paceibacterota bacterium]
MKIKVAINGFGRIGRLTLRHIVKNHPHIDVVAINDLAPPDILAHLLRYDSNYGIYEKRIKVKGKELLVDGTTKGEKVLLLSEPDPEKLPWKDLKIDVVLECTGVFRHFEGAEKHLKAGAKQVIISAPAKDDIIPSLVLGVNEDKFDPKTHKIVDMGSCTTNCLAPIAKVLNDKFGIVRGFMTTVHSYTNDQRILDLVHKDPRRARSAAQNIIPTTTGAAKAIGRVIPELKGKLDGLAIRVPTPTVSILDLTCIVKKATIKEEINFVFKKASMQKRLKGILGIEDAPLVSSDYKGNTFSAIVDALSTGVNKNLVKVLAWYDNEWGYASRLAEFCEFVGKKIK